MDLNDVSTVVLTIYDELVNDKESELIIDKIDTAINDTELKEGIREGIERLKELNKVSLTDNIEKNYNDY